MADRLFFTVSTLFVWLALHLPLQRLGAQSTIIKNDEFWFTKMGQPINSQGGGIFSFTDANTGLKKYYWYGVHYHEADIYRDNPALTLPNATFASVTCYSSTDLVNWMFEGDVLKPEEILKHNGNRPTWVGRLGVAFLPAINQYAMFVQHGAQVLITVSDKPTGPFTWHRELNMKDMIGTTNTGDQTVFTDDATGKSYLVYSYGRGRNKIYLSEIGLQDGKVGLLDCTQVFEGQGREGNCMFKYNGRYYMFASNLYGWDASLAYYLVADDIRGPYRPLNNMQVLTGTTDDYAHVTQTGFFVAVKGSKTETIVYCGDRWANFAGNGLGYNQWVPLSFVGDKPHFNSLHAWHLNAQTGNWQVAADNNYVKNGSFEADRKLIPSAVKPVQEQLTGWTTVVQMGNAISQDSALSPTLNYNNSERDRRIVTGEKSLRLSDKVPFKRKVFQTISSTPFVKLPRGKYTLTAKIKNSSGFTRLELYADSRGKRYKERILNENAEWKTISVKDIFVGDGGIEIGFVASGTANSFCLADDVTLVKVQ